MKRPLVFAIPIVVGMILLIIPLGNLKLGGFSEKYLPPSNPVRMAQEHFDKLFPGYRTQQLTLVIQSNNGKKVTDQQVAEIRNDVGSISGFTGKNWRTGRVRRSLTTPAWQARMAPATPRTTRSG